MLPSTAMMEARRLQRSHHMGWLRTLTVMWCGFTDEHACFCRIHDLLLGVNYCVCVCISLSSKNDDQWIILKADACTWKEDDSLMFGWLLSGTRVDSGSMFVAWADRTVVGLAFQVVFIPRHMAWLMSLGHITGKPTGGTLSHDSSGATTYEELERQKVGHKLFSHSWTSKLNSYYKMGFK